MKTSLISIFLLFLANLFLAQKTQPAEIVRKNITITKALTPPKIDGVHDDEVWKNAALAKDFIELEQTNGKPESSEFRTEVKVLYDDTGVYISAKMYDPEPSKIDKELVERDDVGNDDFFVVFLNGYNDKQQSLEFLVQPNGVQYDAKITNDVGEDSDWSAVWYSAAKIENDGWNVEIKIPYSELRFPKKDIQEWGLNFMRNIQRKKTKLTWNFVDNKNGNITLYDGVLKGIENINPPTRLSFLPYLSTYLNKYDQKTSASINGGMDVKYGINDAFTLDTTLIPDFGQTAFDAQVLNLSPFEEQYQERRSFFTEGTELFSKGNLFYSRRVGDYPSKEATLNDGENIVGPLQKVKLLNATKISGRTNKGLGIGFFNAVTKKTDVKIRNEVTGEERSETVEPLANYNVMVFDQRFRGNSSVSLINTNVTRSGEFRDANATALLVDITDKANKYNAYGGFRGSYVNDGSKIFGTNITAGAGKISGKSRYSASLEAVSKNYNIDDLGYTGATNYIDFNGYYGYRILQPTKNFNKINLNTNFNYGRRLDTDLYKNVDLNTNISFLDKKFQDFGAGFHIYPIGRNDIYEPRTFGRYLFIPASYNPFIWYNSDSREKFRYGFTIDYYAFDEKARNRFDNELTLSYRVSDHLSFTYNGNYNVSNREQGFAGRNAGEIYIGNRNRNTVINGLTSQYTLNNKMAVNLSFRHYYTEVNYKSFGILQENGKVLPIDNYTTNDRTYNAWNIDLRYSWWFAPGSQLTLLYQNATENFLDYSKINFRNNFSNLFSEPLNNTLSLKITYYIDYNQAKSWFKQKS